MFMNLLPKESVGSVFRVLLVAGCLTPSIANAGFDWSPPRSAPSAQKAAPIVQDAAPAGPLTPELDALPVPVGNVETTPIIHTEPLVVENPKPVQIPAPAPAPVAAPLPAPTLIAERIEEKPIIAEPVTQAAEPVRNQSYPPRQRPAKPPVQAQSSLPVPTATAAPTPARLTSTPLPDQQTSSLPTPVPVVAPVATPTTSAPVSNDVIEGFGKDIPLAIALRDIVPAHYAYAFSPNNIAGAKISWRGGKQWQAVLQDALAPLGFDLSVAGNTVSISSSKPYNISSAPAALPVPAARPTPAPVADRTIVASRPSNAPTPADISEVAPQSGGASTELPRTASAMDIKATRKWQARPGTTLRQTLEAWSKDSNVELNWTTPYDYPINNAFYFDGEFAQAVDSLLSAYSRETPTPKGRLYPNLPEGPSVLMVN